MNQDHRRAKPRSFHFVAGLLIALLALSLSIVFVSPTTRADTRYGFVTADHPIDVMSDRSGRWFYYMPSAAKGGAPKLAATVRKELLAQGFNEDVSGKPWFRFVRGQHEVIVCNHDEIAWNPVAPKSGVIHGTPANVPGHSLYPVVWVHQPGADMAGVVGFQVKKFVLRW